MTHLKFPHDQLLGVDPHVEEDIVVKTLMTHEGVIIANPIFWPSKKKKSRFCDTADS